MTKKARIARKAPRVPKSDQELQEAMQRLSEAQRSLDAINGRATEEIEKIKANALEDARQHQDTINEAFEGIFLYAEKNRPNLTDGEKRKTVETPHGTFGWRFNPSSVVCRNNEKAMAQIRELGLADTFIREKPELNKEAMLADPETAKKVPGIKIERCEMFFVKPAALNKEIEHNAEKLRQEVA